MKGICVAIGIIGLCALQMELVTLLVLVSGGAWIAYKLFGAVAEHGNW